MSEETSLVYTRIVS